MKKICVITATRAEYGLLYPVIEKIQNDSELELDLIVSGTHLSKSHGYTKQEILEDNVPIASELEILLASDTPSSVSKAMALAINGLSDYLKNNRPDFAIILGDRYEMLAFAIALYNENIPIAHLNGGEITEGALDDNYRHCLTKLSYLHFANCEPHRQRIIQMGEEPCRVYNVGDTSLDNIKNIELCSLDELEQDLGIQLKDKKIIVVTFHPVTTQENNEEQLKELIEAMKTFPDYQYVVTKANADAGGVVINEVWESVQHELPNACVVSSLGMRRFLSLLSYSTMMLGNSSSGIYEAPAFKVPTVNIGDRQKGRLRGETIIDCRGEKDQIISAMELAISEEFQRKVKESHNIFGDGHASEQIVRIIKEYLLENKVKLPKAFYDIKGE